MSNNHNVDVNVADKCTILSGLFDSAHSLHDIYLKLFFTESQCRAFFNNVVNTGKTDM